MKKVLLALILVFSVAGCTRIDPGYVGIRINLYGSQKGVEDYPLQVGRVWYNPYSEDIYSFPTFTQNVIWGKVDGVDESITFNSSEGAIINADIAFTFSIPKEVVPKVFVQLRQDNEYICHNYLRSKVRDAFSRCASTMKVTDIFGAGKQELLDEVLKLLNSEVGYEPDLSHDVSSHQNFIIEMISFVGGLRVDDKVASAISATIEATQKAIEAENKVRQIEAEAKQAVAKAQGLADSLITEAKAKAEANKLITDSINEKLLTYESLKKWDGRLPQVLGGEGALPFIQITPEKPEN